MLNKVEILRINIKKIYPIILYLAVFLLQSAPAQNSYYTHIEGAKNFYNPAINLDYPLSITILHRNNQIYNGLSLINFAAGMDIPINYSYNRLSDALISLYFFDERMNSAGYIKQTGGLISVNQSIRVTKSSLLTLGLQYSYYFKSFGASGYFTGSQWDTYLGFNPGLPNGEQLLHQNITASSLTAGILWQLKNSDNITLGYVGLAGYNLNRPYENFTNLPYRSLPRYSMVAGYRIFDNNKFMIIPELTMYSFAYQQYFSLGLKTGVYTFDNNPFLPFNKGHILIETRYINKNGWIGLVLEQPLYNFGISYDFPINTNQFENSNALELHLTIKLGKKKSSKSAPVAQEYTIGQVRKFFNEQQKSDNSEVAKIQKDTIPSVTKETKPISLALKKDFKFGFNDATLSSEACQYLDELAELLRNNEKIQIEIIGHTDDVGTREANRIISYRRAEVVANYLKSKGISPDRIKITAKLDTEPLFPNTTPENRAKNRRVEFILYYY
jgi:outer membrane protein OmpA-like peptidoglycan-associated protein